MTAAGRLLAHELDGVLVAEPVRPLDGVVHVPAPVVLAHVAERGADAALRGHRVAARRKQLGDAGGRQPALGQTERGAQAGAAGADDDDVVAVVDELVGAHAATSERHLQDGEHAGRGQQHVHEGDQHQRQRAAPRAVHVVLDDHLHAELRMPGGDQHEQDEQQRRPALAHPGASRWRDRATAGRAARPRTRSSAARSAIEVRRCNHQ